MFQTIEEVESYLDERKKFGIKPGLERMEALMNKLPIEHFPPLVHVAGTNGKGSTIQYIQRGLQASNYRVGVFTSPSLTGVCGHFFIDGKESNRTDIVLEMNRLVPIVRELDERGMYATEFEIITVLALVYFSNRVQVLLVETGMGGRFDTTNVFPPAISVITNVALDHEQFLGDSLKKIAYHKAGIIKPHVPVVIGNVDAISEAVIREEAAVKKSRVYKLYDDFTFTVTEQEVVEVAIEQEKLPAFSLQMKGLHQKENVALSCMALALLKRKGLHFSWEKVLKGIATTTVPGRFELLSTQPHIVIDSAHNVHGIRALIETVETTYRNKNVHVLTAMFKDKRYEAMLTALSRAFHSVTLTTFPHYRAMSEQDLLQLQDSLHLPIERDWQQAVEKIINNKKSNDLYLITGSFHFISIVRAFIKQQGF